MATGVIYRPESELASHYFEAVLPRQFVDADWVAELVEHGVIEPISQVHAEWRFTNLTVVRIAKAKRLQRDLELNSPALGVVLDLLDDLRAQLGKVQGPSAS